MSGVKGRDRARGLPLAAPSDRAPAGPLLAPAVLLARTLLTVTIGLWLAALVPALFGMTLSTVMSDSMAPAFVAGDSVVVRPAPASAVRVGEVVLVDDPDRPGRLRLHRLVAERNGDLVLRGDANQANDSSVVLPQHVRGVAVLRVPFAGLPDYWLRTGAVLPLAIFGAAMAGLGLLACADIGPPPRVPRRRPVIARILPLGRRRAIGVRALVLLGTLGMTTAAAGGGLQSWAAFSGIVTSSTNTIGANTLFTNCPARPAGLPTPSLYYAYTANTGTSETDLAGSNNASVTNATRTAGYCDGSAPSPYLTLTDPNQTTIVSTGSKVSSPSTAFSISLWFNPSSSTGILADFTDKNGAGSQTMTDRQIYYRSDGTLAFGARYGSGTGTPVYCSTPAPTTGTWHHALATAATDGTLTLYLDGAVACTVTAVGSPAPNGAVGGGFWSFGGETKYAAWSEASAGFVGGLDETAIYTSALTVTDASNLYAAGH